MSSFVKLLPPTILEENESTPIQAEPLIEEQKPSERLPDWTLGGFAEEQIRGLVRQVFLPGWPRHCRQVVFSAVDKGTDILSICMKVGQTLAEEGLGTACVVESFGNGRSRNGKAPEAAAEMRFGTLRDLSQQLSSRFWFMPHSVFLGGNENELSTAWLRARLAELRLEFDYTVLHGPAAVAGTEAAALGAACDGLVLVLQADSTRRATAQRVKETLHFANARLLGAVLSDRSFPIPSAIYKRL